MQAKDFVVFSPAFGEKLVQARGKLKLKNQLMLGDLVELEEVENEFDGENKNQFVISKLLERKNQILRPAISNIDKLFIVIANEPKPDFKLIDTMLVFAKKQKIEPLIIVNKSDLDGSSEIFKITLSKYQNVCGVFFTSAKTKNGVKDLQKFLMGDDKKEKTNYSKNNQSLTKNEIISNEVEKNKVTNKTSQINGVSEVYSFVGQSAVGKTSLCNALFQTNFKEGELSQKIMRGKNTTVKSVFHQTKQGSLVVDSPGFSFLQIEKLNIKPEELKTFYEDFNFTCKFYNCNHMGEDGCGINEAIKNKTVEENRYEIYTDLFTALKNNRRY
jgi:ribosome biogenesis GTPase